MTTYTQPTGTAGTMRIDDDGSQYVDFYLLGVNQVVDQVPWTYVLNGQLQSWRAFRLEANTAWQKVTSLLVSTTQDVTFRLGASGNARLGGPADFTIEVERVSLVSTGHGYARVLVNGVYRQAIPYVNDNGEWKQAEPWGKIAGIWKPAPS